MLLAILSISNIFCFASEGFTSSNKGDESTQISQANFEVLNVNVVFRGTQKLRSSAGVEIYFYTNGICKWYDNDRYQFSCKYNINGGEVYFYDTDGSIAYKGRISWSRDGSPYSITIGGEVFKKVR